MQFTVTQLSGASAVISVGAVIKQFAVRNGTLSGGQRGVDATTTPGIKRLVVEEVTVVGATAEAIRTTDVGQLTIRRVTVDGLSGSTGVNIGNTLSNKTQGVVEGNLINGVTNGILVAQGAGLAVSKNRLSFGGAAGQGFGIRANSCHGCQITENSISFLENGITLVAGKGNIISGNTIVSCYYGVEAAIEAKYNVISNNIVRGSSVDGIIVAGDYNRIEWNLLSDNANFGLRLYGNYCTYGRNVARDNHAAGCAVTGSPNFCDVNGNGRSFFDNDFGSGLQ